MNEKILVADDNSKIRELVKEVLVSNGYDVIMAYDGEDAVEKIYKENPALCIIDYEMPRKKGFDVVREVRGRTAYLTMPIIIFTADVNRETKIEGLSLDIDDYLQKPVDGEEIAARVKLLLRRNKQQLDCNPLTRLPGNPSIQTDIEERIKLKKPFAVLYCDLDNFKSFNDKYGFDAGDRILKDTARIISNAAKIDGNSFLGHIGGDDFVLNCGFEYAAEIAQKIIADFSAAAPFYYNEADRAQGFMLSKNRQGRKEHYRFLSISIGAVHNTLRPLTSFAQVSSIAAEVKAFAKKQPGSYCFFDRRKDSPCR